MTDRLKHASDRVALARMRLERRGAQDLTDALTPRGQSYEAAVSGSGGTSGPEAAATVGTLRQAGVAQQATRLLEKAATLLERGLEQLDYTPTPDGGQCATRTDEVRCTGQATHSRDRCATCHTDWRTRRGVDIPPEVIAARNARRVVKCECARTGCDHDPGVCTRDLEPGQQTGRCDTCLDAAQPRCTCGPDCCPDGCRDSQQNGTLSHRCHKRRQRAKAAAGEVPWQWHETH